MMNEEELLSNVKKNKKYFNLVYENNYSRIYNYISKHISEKENVEDILSITFEKALKGIDNFQWEGVSISNWLYRIARNTINDFYREKYKRKIVSLDSNINGNVIEAFDKDEINFEQKLVISEEEDLLYKVLQNFDQIDQYLIYYKYFEALKNKEIAKILKMSETNIGTRLQRIRSKIKNILHTYE